MSAFQHGLAGASAPPPTILIGFAESLPAPEAAWSLLDAGFRVVAFTRRGRRPPLRRCRSVRLTEIIAPEEDAEGAEASLRRLASSLAPELVMPLDDIAVHLCAQALPDGAAVAGPTGEHARLALDKRLQLRAARRAGFDVPHTVELASPAEALDGIELPAVLKPALAVVARDGVLKTGESFICADRAELERAVGRLPPDEPLLVQSLLRGVGEGLFGLATTRGAGAWSAHRRVRMMNPHGSGSSACVSAPVDPLVVDPARRLLAGAGWRGLFMIELLRDSNGVAWFMELNGRAWGSLALARRCGFEYPAWAIADLLDPEFEAPYVDSDGTPIVCRHLGREILHVLFVIRGPRSKAMTDWPPRLHTLLDVLRTGRHNRLYNSRAGDRAILLEDTYRTVVDQLRRL
jgi:predicted ATP-grasp superfamily ATP-dependent carboligase